MKCAIFCHSLVSDWNHGNANFLRGVCSELIERDHEVRVFEPRDAWSRRNLIETCGPAAVADFERAFPLLRSREYDLDTLDLDQALEGVDVVLAHEWSDPELVRRLGDHRARSRSYRLLFWDTHHRARTRPDDVAGLELQHYDGVLAFGEVIRRIYLERGWAERAWTWHEAADTRVFRPLEREPEADLVWIGNWGDGERTKELRRLLFEPARRAGLSGSVHGVRYPLRGRWRIRRSGLSYQGWLPNHRVPEAFARHRMTVHVPRRPYVEALPGIPTIRVFEALACGIPLVCAPWDDAEELFRPGEDFLVAADSSRMEHAMRALAGDAELRDELRRKGLQRIAKRHTCAHRVDELLSIVAEFDREALDEPAGAGAASA